ncbi:hypothetical protein PFISCL1PPCAC_18561 [Pristionchus fissidentatus]|uniref:Glutathione S-transferase n=1 Tax=Pristionchus fissidentatus TaxID=1538716 RepID=A0AAV5WBQ8_9BILA|nr:hypothetical protein PFISCL1PPCAC_18561 [Pristionchus fissidentatus]
MNSTSHSLTHRPVQRVYSMTPALLKRDWERNHVYLFTYPRCRRIPNISPWSLKLETWLRMMRIPYTATSTNFSCSQSSKHTLPFVEVNGRQIADSNIIIESLTKQFNVTADSTAADKVSLARALTALVEEDMTPTISALLLPDVDYYVSDEAWGPHLGRGIIKWARKQWLMRRMRRQISARTLVQGAGRHSYLEQTELIKEGLDALSTLLGHDDQYFVESTPSTIDATVFGHIAFLIYGPTPDGILTDYLRLTHPNLGRFIETMKEAYWPDWEETCSTRNMNTHQNTYQNT